MDGIAGFLTPATLRTIEESIVRGYRSAQDLQNPPLAVQLMRESQITGEMEPVGDPFQPIHIRFGLREVTTYGGNTPVVTARTDADMLVWGTDPTTGDRTPESHLRIGDFIEWTVEGREHAARISAIYPIEHHAMQVEIELVQ